jgi:hypothetical protein
MRRNGWNRAAAAVAIVVATATLGGAARAPAATPRKDVRMPGTYTTAYNWWDNNPPGSAQISHPVVHRRAGGQGTYADPLTVAVDYGRSGHGLQFRAGTRFYVPNVRAYLIVEDTIGRTAGGRPHLDMWAGGKSSTERSSYNCMRHVTGTVLVIRNPSRKYAVVKGPLSAHNKCRKLYGNKVVRVRKQVR